ncbi:hypothetical protein EON63_05145, partial [archaeon]
MFTKMMKRKMVWWCAAEYLRHYSLLSVHYTPYTLHHTPSTDIPAPPNYIYCMQCKEYLHPDDFSRKMKLIPVVRCMVYGVCCTALYQFNGRMLFCCRRNMRRMSHTAFVTRVPVHSVLHTGTIVHRTINLYIIPYVIYHTPYIRTPKRSAVG